MDEGPYLFDRPLHDVADDGHLSLLAHPHRAGNRLFLHEGVPLRLDEVHLVGGGYR